MGTVDHSTGLFPFLRSTAFAPRSQAAAGGALALTHVTVIDATGAPPQPDTTVVIDAGRIAALGPSSQTPVPTGARVLDATGQYLIPGLWDMHVHTLLEGLPDYCFPLFLANGITGVRDMGSQLTVAKIDALRRDIAAGRRLGPRIVAPGPVIDGPIPVWPFSLKTGTEADGRQVVQALRQQGADFIKPYSLLPRAAYDGLAAACRAQGISFAGHVPVSSSVAEVSDAGQMSIEHMNDFPLACCTREGEMLQERRTALRDGDIHSLLAVFHAQRRAMLDTFSRDRAAELAARLAGNGTWSCPTLIVSREVAFLNEPAYTTEDARLKYVPRPVREQWSHALDDFRMRDLYGEALPVTRGIYGGYLEIAGIMRRAGVRFLAGTDLANQYVYPGFSLHDELTLLVETGLTPLEALQTATRNPAEFFGLSDLFGTVAPGKVADLVLLDADPLVDIRNTQRIAAVVQAGHMLDRATLQRMLAASEEYADRYTAAPMQIERG